MTRSPALVTAILVLTAAGPLLGTPVHAQEPLREIDGPRVLEQAAARYAALEGFCAEFHQTIDVTLLRQTKESHGTLCQRRPERFEMRWLEPAGDRIVADGSDLWVYFPSTDEGQAFRTSLVESGQRYDLHREFLSEPGMRYDASFLGREDVGGEATYVVELEPRIQSPYLRAKLWIGTSDHLIKKLEILEESESVRTLVLTNTRLNPSLSADWFAFEPPRDVQVITR